MVPVTLDNVLKTYKIGVNIFEVTSEDAIEGTFEDDLRETIENHFNLDPSIIADEDDQRSLVIPIIHICYVMLCCIINVYKGRMYYLLSSIIAYDVS